MVMDSTVRSSSMKPLRSLTTTTPDRDRRRNRQHQIVIPQQNGHWFTDEQSQQHPAPMGSADIDGFGVPEHRPQQPVPRRGRKIQKCTGVFVAA